MHVGVSIDDVISASEASSSEPVLPATLVTVIDKIADAIPLGFSVDLLTRELVFAFSRLCKCELSKSFMSSDKMERCVAVMMEATMGAIGSEGTVMVVEALISLANNASRANKEADEWSALCAALQVAVNIRPERMLDGAAGAAVLSQLAGLFGAFLSKLSKPIMTDSSTNPLTCKRIEFGVTALAVLNIRHGGLDIAQMISNDSKLQLSVCQAQLQLAKTQLKLQPSEAATHMPCALQERLTGILELLQAGLYPECFTAALDTFGCLEDESELSEIVSQLCKWAASATTWLGITQALQLLHRIADRVTTRELRENLIQKTCIVKILFNILGSGAGVFLDNDGASCLADAQLAAVKLLDGLLGERGQACGMSLPPDLVRKRLVQKLTVLMRRHEECDRQTCKSQELHCAACSCLFKVTARCREVEFSNEQIEQLAMCVDSYDLDHGIAASVFGIQMYLSTRRRYKKQLSKTHHVQRCLKAVESLSTELKVIKPACGVLRNAARNITEDSPTSDQLHSFPWLPIVNAGLRIMKEFPGDSEVQYRTCGILVNIATCTYGANVTEAALREALPLVQLAMKTHVDHAELHMWSLHFFLQYGATSLPIAVGTQVLQTVEKYENNAELQLLGMSVAQKLASVHGLDKMKKAGWVPRMLTRLYACCESKDCLEFEDLPFVAMQLLSKLLDHCKDSSEQLTQAKSAIHNVQNFVDSSDKLGDDDDDRRTEVHDACELALHLCDEMLPMAASALHDRNR